MSMFLRNRRWMLAASLAWLVMACGQPTKLVTSAAAEEAPSARRAPTLYGQTIVIPADAGAELQASAADAADALGKMTGKPFAVRHDVAERAIVLLRADSPNAAAADVAHLKGKGREPFVIRGSGRRLTITANGDAGLSVGLYFYLREIGCRWLLPNDHWTIIPAKGEIGLDIDRLIVPDYQMRGFFGTGGFGPLSPIDPKLEMRSRWDLWKRRNLFGGEYALAGHSFEGFYASHKKELDEHAEYGSMVDGKRVPWSVRNKPCFSNSEFIRIYTQDRLAILRKNPGMFAVSVEPSDGAGSCQCDKCRALGNGSESDQVFYLTNQVAKAVATEFPGHFVSLYAYAEHAAVTTLPLEPNVYVVVVPYGFQRTGMNGDDLLAAWRGKAPRMGIYDYWSIPDWAHDQPSFNYLAMPDRLRNWHKLGVEGFSGESTTSAGAMGISWYIASRVMWDLHADDVAVREEFYRLGFGAAAAPMKRVLERWARGYMLTTHELGLCYRDLAEARKLAGSDATVLRRLSDYEQYVHYLRLWYEFQHPAKSETPANARELVTYLWRIYPTAMVTTYRMYQLVANRMAKNPELAAEFDARNKDAAGWKAATPLGAAELAGLMADGAAKYQPLPIEMRTYSENLVAPKNPPARHGEWSPPMTFGGTVIFEIEALPGIKDVPLRITVSDKPKSTGDRVTAYGPEGEKVLAQPLPADGQTRDIRIPTATPGRYRVEVFDQKTIFSLCAPAGVPLIMRSFTSPGLSSRLYFFVPVGLKKGAFHAPGVIPIKLRNADGQLVKDETAGPLVVFDVPPGQDGRAWSLEGYKAWAPIGMLNLPPAFSFFPDTLMVPENAAASR